MNDSALIARRGRSVATGLLLGSLVITTSGCGGDDAAGAAAKGGGRPPALVKVEPIVRRDVSPKVVVVGSVTPRFTSIVASGANGIVDQFFVEEGQFVKQDADLSVLRMVTTNLGIAEARAIQREREQKFEELKKSRPEEIAEANAKMLASRIIMNNAKKKLDRTKTLFEQNAANRDEYDDAIERYEAAEQLALAARAVHDRITAGPRKELRAQALAAFEAQQEQVKFLEAEKAKRTTKAPFDGYVVDVLSFVGQWQSKGDPVVQLAYLDEVDVVANVDQRDLEHVRVGQDISVTIPGSNRSEWTGKVIDIVPRSEWQSGSRGFPVEVRLTNEFTLVDGKRLPALREGMMAEVTFRGTPRSVLLVPKNALVRGTDGSNIHVLNPKTSATHEVAVTLGLSEGQMIEVIADELREGMQVVTEGAERLREASPVRIAGAAPPSGKAKPKPETGR